MEAYGDGRDGGVNLVILRPWLMTQFVLLTPSHFSHRYNSKAYCNNKGKANELAANKSVQKPVELEWNVNQIHARLRNNQTDWKVCHLLKDATQDLLCLSSYWSIGLYDLGHHLQRPTHFSCVIDRSSRIGCNDVLTLLGQLRGWQTLFQSHSLTNGRLPDDGISSRPVVTREARIIRLPS